MPVILTRRLLISKSFYAINICGLIFSRGKLTSTQLNHERIHTRQQCEMLFVFFYLWYGVEWVVRFIIHRNLMRAYLNISFEREAYAHERDLGYLHSRPLFAWWKYRGTQAPLTLPKGGSPDSN